MFFRFTMYMTIYCFFTKKNKNGVRFVGQKQNKVPDYTGISYNVKEWGPTLNTLKGAEKTQKL